MLARGQSLVYERLDGLRVNASQMLIELRV